MIYIDNKAFRIYMPSTRTLASNKTVVHSDEDGAPPVGAAPPTSSFST